MLLLNALAFQLCWFAAVMAGDFAAVLAVGLFVLVHMWQVKPGEISLIICVTVAGAGWDTLLLNIGMIRFPDHNLYLIPPWLLLLWLAFAMTLRHSLHWCVRRLWLAIPLVAIAAPLSYFAGARLGAIELNAYALLLISAGWAVLMAVISFTTSSTAGKNLLNKIRKSTLQ